ncbi:MAG: HEAT repeat domain-containing protein [Pirellulaceae bacterium]
MHISDSEWIDATCSWLKQSATETPGENITAAVAAAEISEIDRLLETLVLNFDTLGASPRRLRILMQLTASRMLQPSSDFTPLPPETLAAVYDRLSEVDGQAAAHALQIMASQAVAGQGDEESIHCLAAILVESPPSNWQQVALALSPLWKASSDLLELFFDRLYDGFVHPATLAVLLDLANYSVRRGAFREHPWTHKQPELNSLLQSVVAQLEKLEKAPSEFGTSVDDVQRILGDSVALTVSLCDALGLIGNPQSLSSLSTALDLSHRRIQTEAACGLARLGDVRGKQRLIELAADPVARQRAVAYADELSFAEEIDEQLRYPQALAESELAAWLASPNQFGIPPSTIECIDSRTQYWPSYHEPQDCFLFRFSYALPTGTLSNIGIAGPVTHAFQADLANLPIDDIYAAFAGWQAEHEEIFEVPMPLLNPAQRREADRLIAELEAGGFEVTESIALTFFLGEVALLAKLSQAGKPLCAITDGVETMRLATSDHPSAMTPEVVLAIYRGRKLLRTFNP